MSSMRNVTQRRNHKERAQPKEREKWGILEKHKDYSLRARDYQDKKKRLKTLREKAAERNPDEFSYGMLSNKQSKQGTILGDRGNKVLSHDAVKLLKTQDAGYLATMLQKTRRAIEKLQCEFFLPRDQGPEILGESASQGEGQHVVFVGNREEQKQYDPTTALALSQERNKTPQYEILHDGATRDASPDIPNEPPKSNHAAKKAELAAKEDSLRRKQRKNEQTARKERLEALKTRAKDLEDARLELELQRAKMSNSVGGVTKAGVKWKVRERKR